MKALLHYLIYFPSVTFSLVKAEIFPYGIIFWAANKGRLYISECAFFVLMLLSVIYGAFLSGDFDAEAIRSFAAYANVILLFFIYAKGVGHNNNLVVHKRVLLGMIALGIFQYTGIASLLGMDFLLNFLMERGNSDIFGNGRGVSLLTSEPSRAATEFVFISCSLLVLLDEKFNQIQKSIYALLVILFVVLILRSGTGLLYALVFFSIYYLKYSIIIACISTLIIPILVLSLKDYATDVRAIDLLVKVFSQTSLEDLFTLLLNASGFRAISVYGSYLYGFENIFGGGIGRWIESSVIAMESTDIGASSIAYFAQRTGGIYTPVRPTSFGASFALDAGLIGLIALFLCLFKYIKIGCSSRVTLPITILFLFYVIFLGGIGNPIPWVSFALCISAKQLCSK